MVTSWLAPGMLPPGERIYAIGDVHGRADLLAAMHARIAADLAARPIPAATLVHLGDYVDRGPDSASVIALLADPPQGPLRDLAHVHLRGNHEEMMLRALEGDAAAAALWLRNGGVATLASLGVRDLPELTDTAAWHRAIPPAHLDWLRGLRLSHRCGDYFFVHAGVRPGVPLDAQIEEDLLWIREPFLSWRGAFGAVVVHGHTPGAAPVILPNRIGIDTAAAMGGVLSCLVLQHDTVAIFQV